MRAFADGVRAGGRRVDLMINSAGIMANPETRVGPGWESQFATNHLGHFALVNRLRQSKTANVLFALQLGSLGAGVLRPPPARSTRRCSGTCDASRWSTTAGSTRTAL